MSNSEKNNRTQQILNFLQKEGFVDTSEKILLTPLSGDGSSRLFYKIRTGAAASFCGVLPGNENAQQGMAEAHAAYNIGSHLKKRGLPVPAIHAFDPENGFILFEDLGETLLHDVLKKRGWRPLMGIKSRDLQTNYRTPALYADFRQYPL